MAGGRRSYLLLTAHRSLRALTTRCPPLATQLADRLVTVDENVLVERYRRFHKGEGWLGCAPKDPRAPVVFFYMHKGGAADALKPQFTSSDPTKVKAETLKQVGFNAQRASSAARSEYAWRLDVEGAGAKELDQRNVPVAPASLVPHRQSEWFALGSLGLPPAKYHRRRLADGWSAHARSPPLPPLPMQEAVVRDGPRPSGWAAIAWLAKAKPHPSSWVDMRMVLHAAVGVAARGPAEARGSPAPLQLSPRRSNSPRAAPTLPLQPNSGPRRRRSLRLGAGHVKVTTLSEVPPARAADLKELSALTCDWKKEAVEYKASDEYKEAQKRKEKARARCARGHTSHQPTRSLGATSCARSASVGHFGGRWQPTPRRVVMPRQRRRWPTMRRWRRVQQRRRPR